LQDGLVAPNAFIFMENGTLTTNNQNLECYYLISNSNTSNNRTINLGSTTVTINYQWNIYNATNFVVNAGTSVINFTSPSAWLNAGSQSFYDIHFLSPLTLIYQYGISNTGSFHNVSFVGDGTISGSNTANDITIGKAALLYGTCFFHDLTVGTTAYFNNYNSSFHDVIVLGDAYMTGNSSYHSLRIYGNGTISATNSFDSLILTPGKTYAFGETQNINFLDANGTCSRPITIWSTAEGSQANFNSSVASINADYVRVRDINAVGSALFTANHVQDLGNNTGWNLNNSSPKNLYWVGGSGNWNDAFNWSSSSGGPGGDCIPTIYDDVYFDNHSFNIQSQAVYFDALSYCHNMNWLDATNSPVITGSSSLHVYGSLLLIPSLSSSFTGALYFKSTTTGNTIATANVPFANNVFFDGVGGGWTLADAFTVNNGAIFLKNGNLNTNNKNISCYSFISSYTTPRILELGTSTINLNYNWNFANATNLSLSASNSTINLSLDYALFQGGDQIYNDVNFLSESTSVYSGPSLSGNNVFENVHFAGSGIISGNNTIITVDFVGEGWIYGTDQIKKLIYENNGNVYSSNIIDTIILTPGHSYLFGGGSVQSIRYLSATGIQNSRITINSLSGQAEFNKTTGSICCDYLNLQNIKTSGGAFFYAGANSSDLGNNSGWSFTGTFGIKIDHQNETCSAAGNGYAKVTAQGCSGPFTYLWSNSATTDSIGNLSAGTYVVTVTDAQSNQLTDSVYIASDSSGNCAMILNLKIFIHGFYLGNGQMQAVLYNNGLSDNPSACDSIIVELHDVNIPDNILYSLNGIIDIYGNGNFTFPAGVNGNNYYIVVKHRSSIETWSKTPVLFNSSFVNFDFTTP